jgi:hypothetical protein
MANINAPPQLPHLPPLPVPRGTFAGEKKHPSRGGNPYSDDFRLDVIMRYQLGLPLVTDELNALRAEYVYPSMSSCRRYINKHNVLGHCRAMLKTGNHEAERTVTGQSLVNLALFRVVFPAATIDEARAYLFNMDPTLGAPFRPAAVVDAEHLLGLRRKASSTTCKRAFLPLNEHKRHVFWNHNYPFGRADVRTQDIIDVDEAGFKIESTNPSFGKTVSWSRCYLEGEYNRDRKVNCLMGISADRNYNMEWHDVWPQEEGGTDVYRILVFFQRVIARLALDHPGRSFCFTMDNLNSHKNPMVLNLITGAGHRYLFRAPYWSVDGPIEYVFNTIHTHLLLFFTEIHDLDQLENCLNEIINDIGGFERYFFRVGFPDT